VDVAKPAKEPEKPARPRPTLPDPSEGIKTGKPAKPK
jgi:hypothetical protein